jgi:hypothetical protein
MTPSGIEPATFRFVAQHLNHWATAVPTINNNIHNAMGSWSQWPRGLSRGAPFSRLLGLWVWHCSVSVVSVVCRQVEVSASGWSLVQRSPTGCAELECDREVLNVREPCPTSRCCALRNIVKCTTTWKSVQGLRLRTVYSWSWRWIEGSFSHHTPVSFLVRKCHYFHCVRDSMILQSVWTPQTEQKILFWFSWFHASCRL